MLRVRDIMTTDVIWLDASAPVEEARRTLVGEHIGGAPVLDGGRVVGVLSKTDLVDPARDAEHQIAIRDVMTPLVHYLRPGDQAVAAIDMMLREHIHRVIVVQNGNHLAGVVTTTDVLRAVQGGAQLVAGTPPEERHSEPASAAPPRR
jgi:predicted transcriptional regulator